jgi:hypothetical protein
MVLKLSKWIMGLDLMVSESRQQCDPQVQTVLDEVEVPQKRKLLEINCGDLNMKYSFNNFL